MERLPPQIRPISRQLDFIKTCTNRTQYNNFVRANFAITDTWLSHVPIYSLDQQRDVRRELYRFYGMVGVIALRHCIPGFERALSYDIKNLGDPRYQLGIASHIGKLDQVALPVKKRLYTEAWKKHGLEAYGAFGLFIKVEKGAVSPKQTQKNIDDVLKRFRQNRNKKRKPIYLPDEHMSKRLAELDFRLQDIQMSDAEFEIQVLPRVAEIFNGIVDSEKVFVKARRTKNQRKFYS